ncbi:MAG: family 20 glycosylhydrolase [Candidatus Acidiferrales bacterium]
MSLLASSQQPSIPHAPQLAALPFRGMPMPANVQFGAGRLQITHSFSVTIEGYREARLDRAVQRFLVDLSHQTGILILNTRPADSVTLVVHTDRASKEIQDVDEDESYTLEVSTSGAKLSAANPLGSMHGLQTFLQLVEITPDGFALPVAHIEDKPRFPWRGLLIDVCRHFLPLDAVERNLDAMAALKMNVLHWHLSENQGFRVESKELPKLQEIGSDGLYYTQAEVRHLIAYARDRGIRVIPEFDMPGHSTAWFAGYPELASAPGPYTIERKWGIFDPTMDPTREETYKFLDKFIGEMAKLFPDHYFHIGGDEVNGKQWAANPKIQEFMRRRGIKRPLDLQRFFNSRIGKILGKHHKIMMGWDEILAPGLPKDAVVQSWHGPKSLADTAKQGYLGVVSNGYYLDFMWPASQHYVLDPIDGDAAALTPEQQSRILGGEACMWTEFVSPENIDSRIWPRTAAIAERLWSPPEVRDLVSMYRRLDAASGRLEWLGLEHKSSYIAMLGRLAGSDDIAALRVLGDAVEPVQDYTRERTAEAAHVVQTSFDPLNRMVDTVAPESEAARLFANQVKDLISSRFSDGVREAQVRAQLTSWRVNHGLLQLLLANSFLLKELAPLSQTLADLGTVGLEALDYIDKGEQAPDAWRMQQLAMIAQAQKPQADLLLVVAPTIRELIEAAAAPARSEQPSVDF